MEMEKSVGYVPRSDGYVPRDLWATCPAQKTTCLRGLAPLSNRVGYVPRDPVPMNLVGYVPRARTVGYVPRADGYVPNVLWATCPALMATCRATFLWATCPAQIVGYVPRAYGYVPNVLWATCPALMATCRATL